MSDLNNVVISRNGVDKTLSKFKIVKGDRKDKEYLAPSITVENWDSDAKWLGVANLVNVAQKWVKAAFQSNWFDSFDAEGNFNLPKFIKESEDFTSTGMKLSEINDQLDEAQAKQALLIMNAETDAETGMFKNGADIKAIKEINETIVALRAMREARSRKGKEAEAPAEPAVAVA